MNGHVDSVNEKLVQVGELIQSAIRNVVTTQQQQPNGASGSAEMPEWPLFQAQRTLLAAAGTLTELVSEPRNRLLEISSQYFEARALHIAADARIPDLLAPYGDSGLDIKKLSDKVGIESRKLSRVLRCLCSIHVFKEVGCDVFANNAISASLVGNEHLRAYILLFGLDLYSSSDYLPKALYDPIKGSSYAVEQTAWQDATSSPNKPRWDWLEENISVSDLKEGRAGSSAKKAAYPGVFGSELKKTIEGKGDQTKVLRPEHGVFSLAMVGGGRVFGQAHLHDFPWASLGNATVVDVGGGAGGFCLQLSKLYQNLNFVVQDRQPVIDKAKAEIWPRENPEALKAGRVQFVGHDFFKTNPTPGADVYWLRYILHDWSDSYCIDILKAIKPAMGPRSRILVCDQVMNTTNGCEELQPAPSPLPANWGYYTRYSHQRDLAMMAIINGIERKPDEFKALVESAGLRLRKIWDCRSQVGLIEVVLPNSELL